MIYCILIFYFFAQFNFRYNVIIDYMKFIIIDFSSMDRKMRISLILWYLEYAVFMRVSLIF
jgi:hypothetical protein